MKTKYIKVSVSEKNEGQTLVCVNKNGIISIGKIHQSRLDYSFTCISYVQGKQTYSYDITHYLEEVPDYEDEMRDVLLQLVGCHTCVHKIPDWLNDKAEELLTKLKTEL